MHALAIVVRADLLEDPVISDQTLYTNDLQVVCDVVLRELCNLPLVTDPLLLDYLALTSHLLSLPSWGGYRHKDFATLLQQIHRASSSFGEEPHAAQLLADTIIQSMGVLTERST